MLTKTNALTKTTVLNMTLFAKFRGWSMLHLSVSATLLTKTTSLNRDTLRQVPRLVDVTLSHVGDVI